MKQLDLQSQQNVADSAYLLSHCQKCLLIQQVFPDTTHFAESTMTRAVGMT